MDDSGKLRIIDKFGPYNNKVSDIELIKFLSEFDHTYMDRSKSKGPDYLVMDNFYENFSLNQADLFGARTEA